MSTQPPPFDRDAFEQQLGRNLAQNGIPPRPRILEQITEEMQRKEPDLARLESIICADVSISGSLIKLVNSPFYGLRRRVESIQDALVLLGLDTVASCIASIVLHQLLPSPPRLERFWDASARIAQVSAWLSRTLGEKEGVHSKDAYTFGLFRDCGIPIMMRKFSGYYDTLALANAEAQRCFTDVEDQLHPTNHTVVGSLLAQAWWLHQDTGNAILHHHSATFIHGNYAVLLSSRVARMIALSQTAEYLVQQATGRCHSSEWIKMQASCLEILDLRHSDLPKLEEEAADFLARLALA
jgi:HD-like signal output (HDOD) protein